MNGFTTKELKGKEVTFAYEGEERRVTVEEVKACNNGQTIILGKDFNRNMAYRSFKVEKVKEFKIL